MNVKNIGALLIDAHKKKELRSPQNLAKYVDFINSKIADIQMIELINILFVMGARGEKFD
jgi:hypothetical protein